MELLDDLPDGLVVADGEGTVVLVNAVAARLLGDGSGVGRPVADVLALADRAGNSWFACTAPYAGLATRSSLTETVWYLADGTELLVTARLVRESTSGPVTRLVVSLRSARARARLDRERSDLVATVAHELRSPLTGVKGFVSTLLAKWDKLNDEQKQLMLETVQADADRLARLIAELLDVARIDTGRLSLHVRPLVFRDAVDRALSTLRAGTRREIRLDVEGEPEFLADPDKFVQVLTNLVDNGLRHGEGVVTVSGRPVEGGGVEFHVDDEGDGISQEIRSRVFTKFWKHGRSGGSGLGMYIVHGLVLAHGGTIRISDAPGGGARVSVVWPGYHG